MNQLPYVRNWLTNYLWENYKNQVSQASIIEKAIQERTKSDVILDHFEVIDLPGQNSGFLPLCQIFSAIGYTVVGRETLEVEQNEFIWMIESDALEKPIKKVLPTVVIGNFWRDKMPSHVRSIIEKYTEAVTLDHVKKIQNLSGKAFLGDAKSAEELISFFKNYFERESPLPTLKDYKDVHAYDELLAWTLVFGRRPNHFAMAIHLLENFDSLEVFKIYIKEKVNICLNKTEGDKEGETEQRTSLNSNVAPIHLADGDIPIMGPFMEFIWRYPQKNHKDPQKWGYYFTGFVTKTANLLLGLIYKKK